MSVELEIKKLGDDLKAYVEKAAGQAAEGVEKVDATLKNEVKNITEQIQTQQKHLDAISAKQNEIRIGAKGAMSFGQELEQKLAQHKEKLAEYKNNKKGFAFDLESKAVGNMGSSANLTGSYFVPEQRVPGVNLKPYEQVHVRDIIPVASTSSNVVRHLRDMGGEGGPTMVAEAGTKPQIDRDLQIFDANVRKIATYFRVPEEMIEDIPYLSTFLSQVGLEEVMVVEDNQLLYGDGTGQNLSGISTNATAFAAGTSVIGSSAQHYDVLRAARKQLRVAKWAPNFVLVNPVDYYDMTSKKDSTNNYILLGGGNGLIPTVDGVRIIEHTAVTAGDFIMGDASKANIFDRAGATVRFYDQDQDNAIKNLVTIVIEKRLTLAIYQPTAFVKGTFSAAITDLTS